MKHTIVIFLMFFALVDKGSGQNYYSDIDYDKIKHVDKRVSKLSISSSNINQVTRKITKPYDTELEKVRAIFVWITHNIRYDCKKLERIKKRKNRKTIKYKTRAEYRQKVKKLKERSTQKAFRKRKGVCENYSRIFIKMCEMSGIEVGYISGNTKTKLYQIGRRPSGLGHGWNWARIDGRIYLFDTTWGSGYADEDCTKFTQKFKDRYFMIPPEMMILTHYPKKEEEQFLENPLSKEAFGITPLFEIGFKKFKVIDFQPAKGVIEKSQKEVVFKIKFEKPIKEVRLFDQKNTFQFMEEEGYFVYKYTIPENSRRKLEIDILTNDGKKYSVLTYRLQ